MPGAIDTRGAVEGWVERIGPDRIKGWVWRVGSDDRLTVEAAFAGRPIGHAVADQGRDDLRATGRGDGRYGFLITCDLPPEALAPGAVEVRVAGSGVVLPVLDTALPELAGPSTPGLATLPAATRVATPPRAPDAGVATSPPAPLARGPGTPSAPATAVEGFVDSLDAEAVHGWAWQPGSGLRIEVELVAGNTVLARAVADRLRADLRAAGKGDGQHAFRFELPPGTVPGPDAYVRVKDGPVLRLTKSAVPGPAIAPVIAPVGCRGGITGVTSGRLQGWVEAPDGHAKLLVTVDGTVIGEAEARTGTSVPGASDGPGRRGFTIAVPPALLDGRRRRVALFEAASGRPIPLAPDQVVFGEARPAALKAAPALPPPPPEPRPAAAARRVAVVAWDMAHNPVGRAYLLADMAARGHAAQLFGPISAAYGGRLWPPIADSALPIRGFPTTDLASLVAGATALAEQVSCDIVHVGKPRLPSLLLGALIRQRNNCPMVVDIDDHELSFVKNQTQAGWDEVTRALTEDPAQIDTPHSELWTRFAETLVAEADGITVSNVALQRRFGGVIVRHGRDEDSFDPARHDRDRVRAEFGFGPADRVLLFLGTPRPHKGIFEIADALERIGDDRLVLCVIGSINDKRVQARFDGYKRARIALHPDQPWQRLPELVNMADAAPILQDPAHAISQYQIPAKLTDALALDVPVIATAVPPLADLALSGAFETVTDAAGLDASLRRLAESPPRRPGEGPGRALFLSELSYAVNRARLDLAYQAALRRPASALVGFDRLFRLLESRTGIALPRLAADPAPPPRPRARLPAKAPPRDLVFLWKQNDSDIYGRRSDMIAKYLLETGRVRRVLHFDAPMNNEELDRQAVLTGEGTSNQGNLVYVNTVRRILRAADAPNFLRRTFLHRAGSKPVRAFGAELPPRDAYPDFIRDVLREAGADDRPLLWACPVVFDYPAVAAVVRPGVTVADIIDDQRTFPGSSEAYRQRVIAAYDTILNDADLVLANCEPVRRAFAPLRPDIAVVPNGAELFPDAASWPPAPELAGLPRPIIGYVGNLRDRVDFTLLEAAAERFPKASIVLVGSAHGRPEVAEMAARWPNLHMLGVRPYEQAQRIIRSLDLAIMPHLKTDQSDRMNPLKLYVYFALGVPVVTTDVANIGDLSAHVSVASDRAGFLRAIAAALEGRAPVVTPETRRGILEQVSWTARVREIWRLLEGGP